MFEPLSVITLICLYMGGLFLIALRVERRAQQGVNLVNNPVVYSLSLAVYCTSWTFYGSVGNAARYGMLFVTFYIGPMLLIVFWKTVLAKLVRIRNAYRITSIADFISARYDKSEGIAALVTVIAVIGITPYIALQLIAILSSYEIITGAAATHAPAGARLLIVSLLVVFTIMFGVRRLDPTERHQGMIMAVAVESIVKLTALLAVGIFVAYFMYDGVGDIFNRISESPLRSARDAQAVPYSMWTTYIILSMSAILFLPRQFHMAVVENFDERHVPRAMWLFPAYMLLMTLFVYPIATGGLLSGYPLKDADFFVLKLPFDHGSRWLSLFVFIGGFSAAASMIMISSMTLSTMISNHLLLPLFDRVPSLSFLRRHLLYCRWFAVAGCVLTGYWFARNLGGSYFLVSMGMLSFAAVLQFAPSMLGGIFWKKGNKAGAFCGLGAGFLVWLYTLLVPAFVKTGWIGGSLLSDGPFGLGLLRPEALLGVTGFDPLTHAVFWSLAANVGSYVFGSLYFAQSEEERAIAHDFVDIMAARPASDLRLDKVASIELGEKNEKIRALLRRYFEPEKAEELLERCLREAGLSDKDRGSLAQLVELADKVEKMLAGSIGASAAHNAVRQRAIVTPEERKELSRLYGDILADLKLPPAELKRKIDYHQEREAFLKQQAMELEDRVRERTAELTEAERRLTDIISFLPDPLLVIDQTGKVIAWNRAIEEMTGVKAEAMLGKGDYEYALPFYKERRPILADLALVPLDEFEKKYAHISRQGDVLQGDAIMPSGAYLMAKASVLRDSKGNVVGAIESIQDITERWRTEEALKQSTKEAEEKNRELIEANEKLKELDEMKSSFLSTVSHELRTPLTSVLGFAKIIRKKLEDQVLPAVERENMKAQRAAGQIAGNLDIIIMEGQRLTSLINDVLDLAKMEAGKVDWKQDPFRVEDLIGHAEGVVASLCAQKGLGFVKEIEEGLPVLTGDGDRLIQVMINLLSNAVKFTERGTVACRAARNRDELVVSVMDSGIGIAPEDLPKVFEKFKQIGDTLTNKPKGTGLGLPICRQIVEHHGGRIWVESEPGRGSAFSFSLPFMPTGGDGPAGARGWIKQDT